MTRSPLPNGHVPRAAILLCRISDSRDDDGESTTHGVEDQERRLRLQFETILGWGIHAVLIENDTSAFRRRKIRLPDGRVKMRVIRPKFRTSLEWLEAGTCDGFAAVDLDRALRDPRDLEDLIDLVEMYRIPVGSLTGSLDLSTDAGITMARMMTAVANKASRDASRRAKDHREARALAGQWYGGRRPFGFEADGITHRASEAELIAAGSRDLLAGVSLLDMVRTLDEGGVPTVTGAKWSPKSWTQILRRPRNAGLLVHLGEVIGDAPWEPIVPREQWEAVCRLLDERSVASPPTRARTYLGTGIYLCGRCGASLRSGGSGGTRMVDGKKVARPGYRCSAQSHLGRDAENLDRYVENVLLARCSRKDAARLLVPARPDVDAAALRARIDVLLGNIREMGDDRVLGLITREEYLSAKATAQLEIDAHRGALQAAVADSPLAALIGAEDIVAAWYDMPLSQRRTVLRSVMTVVVHRVPRRRREPGEFDPAAIQIVWRAVPARKQGYVPEVWPPEWLPEHPPVE